MGILKNLKNYWIAIICLSIVALGLLYETSHATTLAELPLPLEENMWNWEYGLGIPPYTEKIIPTYIVTDILNSGNYGSGVNDTCRIVLTNNEKRYPSDYVQIFYATSSPEMISDRNFPMPAIPIYRGTTTVDLECYSNTWTTIDLDAMRFWAETDNNSTQEQNNAIIYGIALMIFFMSYSFTRNMLISYK